MPLFTVNTNLPKSKIPENLALDISKQVSSLTGKPESYISVRINPDQILTFAGSTDPCATCSLEILGKTDNSKFTKTMANFLHEKLQIPAARVFTLFYSLPGSDVGFGLQTFG